MLFRDFYDGLTHAGAGLLDVQQLADGGGNISNVDLARGGSMSNLPAEEQAGDMGIIRVPLAMSRTYR